MREPRNVHKYCLQIVNDKPSFYDRTDFGQNDTIVKQYKNNNMHIYLVFGVNVRPIFSK